MMNFVVVPLSAFPHQPTFTAASVALNPGVHMILVGLLIALAVRRYAT